MTIKTKMTVLFTSIVSILLFVFCAIIYFSSEAYRKNEYKNRLKQEAFIALTILFDKEEISPSLLKLIARNHMTALSEEEIFLFNSNNEAIYTNGISHNEYGRDFLNKIWTEHEMFWEKDGIEKFGMVFHKNNEKYIVITSSIDKYGISKQKNLALLLSSGCLFIILISSIMGNIFAFWLLKPMQKMIGQIDQINASNLILRLSISNENDEIGQLSARFNEMLDRLQTSFALQKSFVSNASHELRTPLTAITGQIQVSLLANDNEQELRLMAKSVLEDVDQLNKLVNNLLDLTSIETEGNSVKLTSLNILDLLLETRSNVLKKYIEGKVVITLKDCNDYLPELNGNEKLLYIAFFNLIENGVKFSIDKSIHIIIEISKNYLSIIFRNLTTNINEDEMIKIFDPFVRLSNAKNINGHGVGLSLSQRIIQIHNGKLSVSMEEEFIQFSLMLHRLRDLKSA